MLASTPQVRSVGASAYYTGIFNPEGTHLYGEGQTKSDAEETSLNRVDPDFLQTMAIEPLAGRLFSAAFPADTSNHIILNEKEVFWHEEGSRQR